MENLLLAVVLWPFIGALISYIIGRYNKDARNWFAIFVTVSDFILMVSLFNYASNTQPLGFVYEGFAGGSLFFLLDGFRYVYGTIAAFMWMMTTIFSREYFGHYRNRNRYYMFNLMTLGSTLGVLLSADFITTFIFFEIMSFTSYVMVIHDEKPKAQRAAQTYMAVAVIGGLAMLMGIFLIKYNVGTTNYVELFEAVKSFISKGGNVNILYISGILMMIGFGGKAGLFPIHIWLPAAHPAAPAPASALLSGILTKSGVFGALIISSRIFFHNETWGMIMLVLGLITMFLGAFLALFSIDLKRTLALSSVSQIGFITVGVGMSCILGHHNALAIRGTILHMVNHSLIKLVLFMFSGAVYMNLHKLDLNDVRGFGRKKPLLMFIFLMGYLSIIGMPFFSGYVSKTLLHESIVEKIWLFENYSAQSSFFRFAEAVFTLSGGFTAAYMTKLFVCIFIEKNNTKQKEYDDLKGKYMNPLSAFALVGSAVILPFLGIVTQYMDKIADFTQGFMFGEAPEHAVHYFQWANLRGAIASLSIGAIVYLLLIRGVMMEKGEDGKTQYVNLWPSWLDFENIVYRPLLGTALPFIGQMVFRVAETLPPFLMAKGYQFFKFIEKSLKKPLKVEEIEEGVSEDEIPGLERIMSSSISYAMLQFSIALIIISVIMISMN